jgi:hypothetical protein
MSTLPEETMSAGHAIAMVDWHIEQHRQSPGVSGTVIKFEEWAAVKRFIAKATEELRVVEREIGVPSEALKMIEAKPARKT